MNGVDIYKDIMASRDYSGSDADMYASDINTFYFQAILHGEEEEFLRLLEQAHHERRKIAFQSPFDEDVCNEDVYVKDLKLS